MAKTKSPTPQELYKQRREREEEERDALLPPGLWNHGNTCFMNSVLQGLIATRFLSELAHFEPLSHPFIDDSNGAQLTPLSRRSPLLTNGYGQAGEYEQDWVDTMPIGDVFIQLMLRAWKSQSQRKRESLSPKPLLTTLGKKYDQYLDFAQQDAHEFLRILLDASRMEEQDVIKKRQPPPEKPRKRRRTTMNHAAAVELTSNASASSNATTPPIPDEDKLISLADMVFGGKLTSILVCQKCKHISQTYEDFNDISLSIQAEDYHKRKRDRLKKLARKLAAFPLASSSASSSSGALDVPRPSSVPPSPKEIGLKQQGGLAEPPVASDPRRKSLDIVRDPLPEGSAVSSREDVSAAAAIVEDQSFSNDIVIVEKPELSPPPKADRGKDNWAKFGKRISASIGLGKAWKDNDKEKQISKQTTRSSAEIGRPSLSPSSTSTTVPTESIASSTRKTSGSGSTTLGSEPASYAPTPAIILSRPSTPPLSQSPAPIAPTPISAPKATGAARMSEPLRSKSPKPPKPSTAQLAYLREILADISPPSSASGGLGNLLKPPHSHLFHTQSNGTKADSTTAPSSQNLWLSMSHYSGVEECLRMFTAVEILDGENMVGCRRCWKIANGQLPTADEEEDSDNAEKEREEQELPQPSLPTRPSLRLSPPTVHIPTSMSTPTVGVYTYPDSDDRRSVSSLPADVSTPGVDQSDTDASSEPEQPHQTVRIVPPSPASDSKPDAIPTAMPISARSHSAQPNGDLSPKAQPMNRSASAPNGESTDLTTPTPATQATPRLVQISAHLPATDASGPSNTLSLPTRGHHAEQETDESSGAESEASSIGIIESTQPSRTGSTDSSTPSKPLPPSLAPTRRPAKTSKPKPTIMRPAYKRYLIAVPPPVLVIHLKRFQQITKVPMISFSQFSHGFKKLDDYVSFPEHLDVTPYLAPRKEDFGLGKSGNKGGKAKDRGKCMYRLYAVIVHLGNMLGGHYIAYTALPEPEPSNDSAQGKDRPKGSSTQSPSPRKWAYISDTVVRLTTLEEVLKAKAYICMYERI